MGDLLQLTITSLSSAGSLALVSVGLVLVRRTSQILHVAHFGVFALSAYVIAMGQRDWGMSPLVSVALACVVAVVAGTLLDVGIYRPLRERRVPHSSFLLASLGVLIASIGLLTVLFGAQLIAIPTSAESWSFGGAVIVPNQVYEFSICAIAYLALSLVLARSTLGRQIDAVSMNPDRARTIGISAGRVHRIVISLASLLAVPSAYFQVADRGITSGAPVQLMLLALAVIIIGGPTSYQGALVGALIVSVIQTVLVYWGWSEWQQAATFSMLILILLLRPNGLIVDRWIRESGLSMSRNG